MNLCYDPNRMMLGLGDKVRYEILGPLRLTGSRGPVPLEAKKLQIVLATLLICREQVVSVDRLIGEIWGEWPPRRAIAGIHVYISHIRRTLSKASGQGKPVVTRPPGYMLQLGADELDFDEFQTAVAAGKVAYRNQCHEEAVCNLQNALQLWRGPLENDVNHGPIMRGFTLQVEERRLECVELMISSSLALGDYREMVGYLYSLISAHPLHEAFYQKLMFALYHTGRRGDALKVYQIARETLKDELGLEPSRPLQELQQKILTTDDAR
jgi:SARP family transcriptional regulator, regulator of embCAB operon